MSRIIVKGLPPKCNETQLREHFKKYGKISDCSLKYTKEGKFRRFAFVGFEGDSDGSNAIAKTNQTFYGSYKLQVEECAPFGGESKPRAWSKYAKDSSAYKRKHGDEVPSTAEKRPKREENGEDNDDEEASKKANKVKHAEDFRNFLDAKGVSVEDDKTPVAPDVKSANERDAALLSMLTQDIKGEANLSLLVSGLPSSIKPTHLKEWFAPVRVKALKVVRDDKAAASFISFEKAADVRRASQKNGQFLGGYKITVAPVPAQKDARGDADDDGDAGGQPSMSREEEEAKIRDAILDTGRLFLRNLPFSTTEDDLRVLMKKHGELADVQVIIAKATGRCKGFAIVEYVFPESAVAAYAALDGTIFKGRMLHILAGAEKRAEPDADEEADGGDGEGPIDGQEGMEKRRKKGLEEKSSFKKEKAEKMKKNAAKSHSWNALFLGANAVADTLAEKLGVSKADILGGEGGGESAAVRLALAETRIVRETRDFLLANGIRLDAFSRPAAKRSDTVILAKNLPAGVQADELQRMFDKFGDLQKVLIPPEGGVSALIVFGNSVDAKKAFQALAYARFRTQPLYLEWAPGDVFEAGVMAEGTGKDEDDVDQKVDDDDKSTKKMKEESKKRKRGEELTEEEKKAERKSKKHREALKAAEEEVKKEEEEEVKKEEEEEEEEVEKSSKKEKKKDKKTKKVADSDDEKNDVKGDGEEAAEEQEEEREAEEGAVVYVKNLAFDTVDDSLRELFDSRCDIKSAKVSRKFNAAEPSRPLSMGFGFVQFYTRDDAMEAIKTMQGSLLDGHSIELKLSNREVEDDATAGKKRKGVHLLDQGDSTKLIVRNLPFQASQNELESLFSSFGGLKSVRVPKKVGGSGHRGFGFVDFATKGDARRAFEALVHSTHLYGRRLVLEWAKGEDDSVAQLREKTAARFTGQTKEHRKLKKQTEAIEADLKVIDDD